MPSLVVCRCALDGKPAYAVCDRCQALKERDEYHDRLVQAGKATPIVEESVRILANRWPAGSLS